MVAINQQLMIQTHIVVTVSYHPCTSSIEIVLDCNVDAIGVACKINFIGIV